MSRKKQPPPPNQPKPLPVPADEREPSQFPIVGIGASAGGLEALDQFLKHVPAQSGLAFVVVQHLDPTQKDMMAELLQRSTTMPVQQIQDRMTVRPNHVYVIPPAHDLSILHGVLHLLQPAAPRGLRLPIDFFFRALADDRHERSIGVILSGMGSDGSLGVRALRERAGAVFVQDPLTAKFDSMPKSAVASGMADVIAPVDELPDRIIAYLSTAEHRPTPGEDPAGTNQGNLEKVMILLRTNTGHDFSHYKDSAVRRRIERRMGLHQLLRLEDYVRYMVENPPESQLLFMELLIGVTSFFRDPPAWNQLRDEVMPALFAAHPEGGTLRAWVAGCSTGEEAYSLAIVFKEALEAAQPSGKFSMQIFATDLSHEAIDRARGGVYPTNIAAEVSEARLTRFFVEDQQGYRLTKEIREMLIFAPQNLVMDPPFTKLDLLICRNLLIYLDSTLQHKLIPLFHYSLKPGGVLLLGSAETIGSGKHLFAPLAGKTRLYRSLPATGVAERPDFPSGMFGPILSRLDTSAPGHSPPAETPNLKQLADQLLLEHCTPASVLATDHGDILYFSGKSGRYLEPAAGKANLNLFAMARQGLRHALNEAFPRAIREKTPVVLRGVTVGMPSEPLQVDLSVTLLEEPGALHGMVLVVFTDVVPTPGAATQAKAGPVDGSSARLAALGLELEESRGTLRRAREEMQTSQEELRSTNEELQSTNEELTTSKEEMQSMNEELQTVNQELQRKVEELSQSSADMENLLGSTEIATVFLDNALNIRRFTTRAASIIKVIPGDIGRPVTDLVTDLVYPNFAQDARLVLHTLIAKQVEIPTVDGRWFSVRFLPYRTTDHRINGVVITFTDVSIAKELEGSLREAHTLLERRFTEQSEVLGQARTDLQVELGRRPDGAGEPVTGG